VHFHFSPTALPRRRERDEVRRGASAPLSRGALTRSSRGLMVRRSSTRSCSGTEILRAARRVQIKNCICERGAIIKVFSTITINDYSTILMKAWRLLNLLLRKYCIIVSISLSQITLIDRILSVERITKYQNRKRRYEKWMIDEIWLNRGVKARNKFAVLLIHKYIVKYRTLASLSILGHGII